MANCAKTCDCNLSLINTGLGCFQNGAVEKGSWIVNERDSTGALNYIDLTDTLDDTYFSDKINDLVDPLARFYPMPEMKNITDVRDAPTTYAWNDGTMVFIRDGVRKFAGMVPPESASPQLIGIIDGQRCASPARYSIDANGTIWGRISEDGTKLYPFKMDAKSIYGTYVKTTDSEPTMIAYAFNYHPSERDCSIAGIPASELVGGINPLDYDGLVDVSMKVISASVTKLVVKLYNKFGTPINPETIKGLVVGDFALYNVTDSSAIALTGSGAAFLESPSGTYSLTYATADQPIATNVLRLTPTKIGYDFTNVIATSIVVS